MNIKIPFISSVLQYFGFFWKSARFKLPLFAFISFLTGLSESLGITLFMPLLNQTNASAESNDPLTVFIREIFDALGLDMSINIILAFMAGFFLLKGLFTFCQNMLRIYIKTSIAKQWKVKLLSLYGNVDYKYYIDSSAGYFANILVKESDRALAAFTHYCMLLTSFVAVMVYASFSLSLSWRLTLGAFAATGLFMITIKWIFKKSKKYSEKTSAQNAVLQEYLIQVIHSFKYLRATNRFSKMHNKIVSTIDKLITLEIKQGAVRWTLRVMLELSAIFLIFGLIFYHVSFKGESLASIMVLILFFHRLIKEIHQLQISWNNFCAEIGGVSTLTNAFDLLIENTERSGTEIIDRFEKSIKMENVTFAYGDKTVLSNINLTIKKNSTVAFVGESGAGKSTIIDLITGILKPASGVISIDDRSYADIDIQLFRGMIGFVPQEIVIFDDTIANNVSLWETETAHNDLSGRIVSAAQKADCDKFIQDKSEQYNTRIGDRGVKLSGGQRQRLAIARELFKEPEIIILDEATSSLDTESEFYIRQSIEKLKRQKTIIIIAHRLSTIKNCDYVFVLKDGLLLEEGTYSELYDRKDSNFRKMCEMQSL